MPQFFVDSKLYKIIIEYIKSEINSHEMSIVFCLSIFSNMLSKITKNMAFELKQCMASNNDKLLSF